MLDLEAAFCTVNEFGYDIYEQKTECEPAAVVIKHTNPCGVATGKTLEHALKRALDADRVSAFGGIVALNCNVDETTASEINSLFLECIVAPSFDKSALEILSKKQNLRVIQLKKESIPSTNQYDLKSILGGMVFQQKDNKPVLTDHWELATKHEPSKLQLDDLIFAWKIVRHVRSNAIVIAGSRQSLGIGAGQMNRIGSAKIALESAGEKANGAVLASDGFFPFDDTVKLASKHGINAIVQPGGSRRDPESIKACNELGISMLFTGSRHFLH